MMLKYFILIFVISCQGTRTFNFNPDPEIDRSDDETDVVYEEPDPTPPLPPPAVSWAHWLCCKNLCGTKISDVLSVAKEVDTPFIVCNCKNKKVFKVARIDGN